MTVWKSPVFYFGILLVAAVAGLLAAPFVVNWNGYRTDLEAYGRQLTGRKVEVMGDISVRLFPWPRLTADNVRISNPPGLDVPHLATAERIVVRMTLGGLARGNIDVEAIEIEKPSIYLERLATGEGNWLFQPAENLLKSKLLDRVSLDAIIVHGGTVNFADRRRGEVHVLNDFNADVSAPGLAGPWRLRSTASYGERQLEIGLTTGVWREDEPFRVGLRVAPADGSGFVFGFDGTAGEGLAEGSLRIEPAVASDGKADAEGQLRPLVFTAKVKAGFDVVNLESIEIGPRNPAEGGAITTGSATLSLGRHITAGVDLSASMLDLDQLAGARSRAVLREAGSLAVAGQFLDLLPGDVSLAGHFRVTALKVGGETLDMVNLVISADRSRIDIGELSAGLPGRSRALLRGKMFPSATGPELTGTLAIESNDLRQLSFWAWPDFRTAAESHWTGSRGRMKLQTDLDATLSRFRLTNARYEIDGEGGSGELIMSSGGRDAVEVRLDGNRFDVDSFVPGGLSAVSEARAAGLASLFALVLPHREFPDIRLALRAGELLLNGVAAKDVAVDLSSGANGFDLRTLEIGSVGGARLEAMGLVLDTGNGADGSVTFDVKAEDPQELLRLLGVIDGDIVPVWAKDLGQTSMKANISIKPGDGGAEVEAKVQGTVDELSLRGSATAAPDATFTGQLAVDSATSARLSRLVGLEPAAPDQSPGRIDINAAGKPADGYMVTAALQAYNARADYNGVFDPTAEGYGVDGKISIRSTGILPLVSALGLPAQDVADAVMVIDGSLSYADGKYAMPNIDGRVGSASIKGEAALDSAGAVEAHLETGPLVLADVLGATFLDWTGLGSSLDTSFRTALPLGLLGELWIKPSSLAFHSHFEAREAEIGITAQPGEIRMALFAKAGDGRDARLEVSSQGDSGLRKLEGRITLPVSLEHQLLLAGGQPVASGEGVFDVKFQGEGRSPGGALATITGSGSYAFDSLRILGLSPSNFTTALAAAKDAAGITAAFDKLRGGEGLDFGAAKGMVTITRGEVAFMPIRHSDADADATIDAAAELALGELSADIVLNMKARPNLPAMTITYGGPPAALGRAEDNTELSTTLGVTLMQEGVDELERLQAEQRRLALEEEKQRRADEEKLQAYYAQRDELILRRRELRVHSEMRLLAAEAQRQKLEAEREANAAISKDELKQRVREIRVQRQQAKLWAALAKLKAETPEPEPLDPGPPPEPTPPPKPKPQTEVPAQPRKASASSSDAVILDKPKTAPVIISDPPSLSPSQ